MSHITEQDLEEFKQAMRLERTEQINAIKQELGVQIREAHNNCSGLTREDVRKEIADAPQPNPGLSREDVVGLINEALGNLSTPEPELTTSVVEQLISDAIPESPPAGVSLQEVEGLINQIPGYDDEEIKGRLYRLRVHSNGLADRIGAPRMEG